MSILSELLGAKHREQLLQKQYKLESARQMIESEAKEPGTFDPRMIQLAADTLQMGVVPKEHEGGFHRALGAVLPHIFGKKAPEKPANEGAMSSAGSAAPQAAMMPPPMPPPATADPGASSPILSLNAPQVPISPPPGAAAPPMSPLPASLGQAGSGVGAGPTGPAAPSDTTAPQPLPGIRSDPGQGWTSLGVTPTTTTPPPPPVTQPAGPLLRHGTQQIPFHVNTRAERVQANAPGVLAQAGLEAQVNAQRYAQMKARLEGEDWFKALSPRQKATVLTGQAITPEFRPTNLPGMVHGKDIPDSTTDAFGNPVDKDSMYRVRLGSDGTREYFPEVGTTTTKIIPDEGSPTKFSLVFLDRTGHEVSRTTGATPPAGFVPQTTATSSSSVRMVPQADGSIAAVPVTSSSKTTRQRVLPGSGVQPPPTSIPPPPGQRTVGTVPTAGAGSPGRTVGQSMGMTRMKAENPLTPQAQTIIEQTQPKLEMLRRIKTELAKYKNETTPGTILLPRIAYALGMDSKDMGGFLSQLEVNNIGSAARLLSGTSRAGSVLEKALIHTPNAWKDSGKLMYDKVTQIENALNDVVKTANKVGQRYPGLSSPPAVTPPPGGRKPLAEIFAQ